MFLYVNLTKSQTHNLHQNYILLISRWFSDIMCAETSSQACGGSQDRDSLQKIWNLKPFIKLYLDLGGDVFSSAISRILRLRNSQRWPEDEMQKWQVIFVHAFGKTKRSMLDKQESRFIKYPNGELGMEKKHGLGYPALNIIASRYVVSSSSKCLLFTATYRYESPNTREAF